MKTMRFMALLVSQGLVATSALAQAPAAIVEDVIGNPPGIEFMDYLDTGKVIHLAPLDSIVLS
jgi:hypothetical protein